MSVLGVSLFAVLVPRYRSRLSCGQLQVFLIFGHWEEGCEVLVQILERSWLSVIIVGISLFFYLLGNLAGLFVTMFISAVSFGSFCGLVNCSLIVSLNASLKDLQDAESKSIRRSQVLCWLNCF